MSQPSNDLKSFAALKGWPVTASNGQLFCRGREAGVRWHVWTNPPALAPSLTMVVEVKSGFRFEIVQGPQIRPGTFDFEIEEDPDGRRHFVNVRHISAAIQSWIDSLEPTHLAQLALGEEERIAVYPETVAIMFQAKGLNHSLDRARALLNFTSVLPRSNSAPNAFPNGRNEIEIDRFQGLKMRWSGGRDSNSRSPGPKPGALPS